MKLQQSGLQLSQPALAKVSNLSHKDKPPVQETTFSLIHPRAGPHKANQHHKLHCLLLQMQAHCTVLPSLPSIEQHCSLSLDRVPQHPKIPLFCTTICPRKRKRERTNNANICHPSPNVPSPPPRKTQVPHHCRNGTTLPQRIG